MASQVRRVIWNTRERVLSTDFNNAEALQHRAMLEMGMAAESGDTHLSGVLRGLLASPVTSTLTVSVTPGIALRAGGTPPTSFDSTVEWIEQRSAETVDLVSFVDGADPRWVVIEITPAEATEVSSGRDEFDPATGTFSNSTVPKVVGSAPTLSVTAGTAQANPPMPAGTSGRIPLAYVYLGPAATDLDVAQVIHCRPLLTKAGQDHAQGGGVGVPATTGSDVDVHAASAEIGGLAMSLARADAVDLDTANMWLSGQSYPAGGTPDLLYLYLAAAPYPAGYTTLAPREFVPNANPSGVNRVLSLTPTTTDLVSGGIIVASTTAPSDNEDAFGNALAGSAVVDPTFNSGPIPASLYLGSVTYAGSGNLLGNQDYAGGGEIRFQTAGLSDLPDESEELLVPASNSGPGNFRLADPMSAAGDQLLPDVAEAARLLVSQTCGVGSDGDCDYTLSVGSVGSLNDLVWQGRGSGLASRSQVVWTYGTDGSFDWSHSVIAGSANTSTMGIATIGYRDAILAQR